MSRRAGLETVRAFSATLFLHFRYWRVCLAQGENFLRVSTPFHVVLTVSRDRGMRVKKIQASLLEQDTIVFR